MFTRIIEGARNGGGAIPVVPAAGLLTRAFRNLGPGLLPFADAATAELPMGRLLRLALFQVTVGMAAVLLIGVIASVVTGIVSRLTVRRFLA